MADDPVIPGSSPGTSQAEKPSWLDVLTAPLQALSEAVTKLTATQEVQGKSLSSLEQSISKLSTGTKEPPAKEPPAKEPPAPVDPALMPAKNEVPAKVAGRKLRFL